jgi:hypothetical protein
MVSDCNIISTLRHKLCRPRRYGIRKAVSFSLGVCISAPRSPSKKDASLYTPRQSPLLRALTSATLRAGTDAWARIRSVSTRRSSELGVTSRGDVGGWFERCLGRLCSSRAMVSDVRPSHGRRSRITWWEMNMRLAEVLCRLKAVVVLGEGDCSAWARHVGRRSML